MGCFAVKFNFLTHSLAQVKKQDSQTRNGVPAPSNNIQEAVIQGYTIRSKDVVRLHVASFMLWLCSRCESLPDASQRFVLLNPYSPELMTHLELTAGSRAQYISTDVGLGVDYIY